MRLRELSFILIVSGCTTTVAANDGGVADAAYDTSVPNSCAMAGFVCQASCSAGLIDQEDYVCGASGDYCCAPAGEGGTDASEDVSVFVDGAKFETGVDASSDDASGDDAGPSVDASKPSDAGHEASDSRTADAGTDATVG